MAVLGGALAAHFGQRGPVGEREDLGEVESALGGTARQRATIQSGLSTEQAKDVVKRIKGTGLKVQAAIQGDQVRVSGKKKDDLQAVMAHLKEANLPFDWKATNYR